MASGRSSKFRHQVNNGLLALAFVLILATSAVSVTSTNQLGASIGLVSHTHQTLELLTRMKVAIGDAQANGLRYLITGDDANQLGQREALSEMFRLKGELNQIMRDNALQRSYLADFSQLNDAFLARSMESMAYKQKALKTGTDMAPVRRIREGVGFSIIKQMRQVLDKMTQEENRLMIMRVEERDTLVKQTNATVLIANALALVAGMIGFTAIRRSQEESEKMLMVELRAEQARRASEEKSSFLANMSHEIRTPMNAIFGFTQLLSDSVIAPVERDWVLSIKKSGQLLLGLINDVLDLSKIEAGKMQLNVQAADLHEIVNETVALFKPLAAEKGIFLTHEVDVAANDPLLIDAQRLRQVLINLLSNAVKYTEHGGVVVRLMLTPAADPQARDLRLLITDSGVGIDPEQIERIFEPFHQADSPDGKVRQGTGLGLSISRRLIDLMSGRIQVSSELGKGSTFLIEIPNVAVAEAMPERHELAQARADFNLLPPLKILVVDDVAWNTEIAAGFLAGSHHEVHIANSGLEALASAKLLKPDLVLMDLRMPGMSGYEANDAIRSDSDLQDSRIVIVAVTASSLGDDEKALRESFDGYVRKPYTPVELFDALHGIFCSPDVLPETARTPQKWTPKLSARWKQLHGESLAELRNSMRIREIGDYAQQLHNFASEAKFELLRSQALVLQRAVQRFDITAVTAALAELATWPEDFNDA